MPTQLAVHWAAAAAPLNRAGLRSTAGRKAPKSGPQCPSAAGADAAWGGTRATRQRVLVATARSLLGVGGPVCRPDGGR